MWLKGVAVEACLVDVRPARWAASALEDAAPVTCRLKRPHAAEPAGCAQALGKEFRVVRRQPVRERRRLYGAAAESACTRAKPGGVQKQKPGGAEYCRVYNSEAGAHHHTHRPRSQVPDVAHRFGRDPVLGCQQLHAFSSVSMHVHGQKTLPRAKSSCACHVYSQHFDRC